MLEEDCSAIAINVLSMRSSHNLLYGLYYLLPRALAVRLLGLVLEADDKAF